ncbi:MAG: aminotransferase class I/II-fold pyridoxal phosphate-dependent enzyme [Propionicimonas sp.]|uniref:pyridoxal phosphate-dependent aminotransferase n=1 Tax=Propionicimonas sp. TaxID=1955623 RepID=UPI002B2135FE|nr:aminotransferase class I/II-fold pyridoxal phosphate-dependent enzyme [Propionicimonas sp.]MEA4945656.1 aminotransferase class I/II-fold pyridoxal phosphate-dependent enzyme [Propionicimonas sp.]
MSRSQRGEVEPFHVMEVVKAAAERQRTHGDAIALCVGQPGTPAPAAVLTAAAAALSEQQLGYTEAAGEWALRERIARHYADSYGVGVDPSDVVVTTGSSGGFLLTLLAGFDPGDPVAMTRPGYPAYRNDILSLGCRLVELAVGEQTRYQPTVAMLEALPEVPAGLVLASPSNPTGTIIDADELAAIAGWCAAHECLLISDEIYHGISYGRRCASARQFGTASVVVGSLSKYHSMTGWRLGWLLLPEQLRRPVELLQGNLAICAPALSQAAAPAAFDASATTELDGHVARYARNRDLLLRRLPELGITSFAPPDGAFYAYCDVGHLTDDSRRWCYQVLEHTGVALAPGIDFDTIDGHRKVRVSFCGDTTELDEAIDRLVGYLGSCRPAGHNQPTDRQRRRQLS